MGRRIGILALVVVTLIAATGAYFTRERWLSMFHPKEIATSETNAHDDHEHGPDRVKLSPQARANLKLDVKPIEVQTYSRAVTIPGVIVDRPGVSDRAISSAVVGVVAYVSARPGDTVKPGDPLFTIRIVSEYMQQSQAELFKTIREKQLVQEQKDRIAELVKIGSEAKENLIKVEQQLQRLAAIEQAYRQDLLTRGLNPDQIKGVTEGRFVKEIVLTAPPLPATASTSTLYEVQELKINLGDQVQAGQTLSILSNHQDLFVEGHAFKQEAALLESAAREGWPVQAEFVDDAPSNWPPFDMRLTIRHLANTVDPVSRTFAFYLPLTNQSRSYLKDGKTFLVWRFRPGQRVRLHVPVEKLDGVIVLPVGAVVREGADAFVFRQNGDFFERKPVHVIYEDRLNVVMANDGSIAPGLFVARNAAATLNRALKASAGGGENHGHDHAGHSHEH